jgi:hypothetical protein
VSASLFPEVEAHVIDMNLFVTFERHDTVDLLERAVRAHDVVFLLPSRVYEELTPANYPYGLPPVDDAIEAGWVEVIDDVNYTNSVVSATMDIVRRYTAAADDRPEHDTEQADAEVGGTTAMLLERGDATSVAVHTRFTRLSRNRAGVDRAWLRGPRPVGPSVRFRRGDRKSVSVPEVIAPTELLETYVACHGNVHSRFITVCRVAKC